MPVRPGFVEGLAFHRLGLAPLPLLDVFGAFSFRVLVAGLRLGVFDSCTEPCDLRRLATDLNVDADSLAALLKALEAIGYLEERSEGWVNTSATNRWLVDREGSGVRSGVEYWARLLEGPLAHPDQNLTNPRDETLYEWLADNQERADVFQEWMVEVFGLAGSEIIKKIPRGSVGDSLLDVGGGHGWYSIELCRENPNLKATILDHPAATRTTSQRIQEAGMGDRISIVNGDYTSYETSKPFDTVLMFNILHGHKTGELDQLLTRSIRWLSDQGHLLIVEQFPDTPGFAKTTTTLLALAYDQLLDGAGHDYTTVKDSLHNAGYTTINRKRMRIARGTSLNQARPYRHHALVGTTPPPS